jgi:hypothetical protein
MNAQDLIKKSTTLFSVKYYDKDGILHAKVSKTKLGNDLMRKKLELEGFRIVEEKEINCKSSDFEEKVENEVRNCDKKKLEELKKEVEKV